MTIYYESHLQTIEINVESTLLQSLQSQGISEMYLAIMLSILINYNENEHAIFLERIVTL